MKTHNFCYTKFGAFVTSSSLGYLVTRVLRFFDQRFVFWEDSTALEFFPRKKTFGKKAEQQTREPTHRFFSLVFQVFLDDQTLAKKPRDSEYETDSLVGTQSTFYIQYV